MHRPHRPLLLSLLGATVLGFAVGCGASDPLNRQAVSGQITLDGAPLETGVVEFSPEDKDGRTGGATVTSGRYAIEQSQGLPPGKYRVRIYAATNSSNPVSDGPPGIAQGPPAQECIPASWNSQSQHIVEVLAKGHNTFEFTVQTQP